MAAAIIGEAVHYGWNLQSPEEPYRVRIPSRNGRLQMTKAKPSRRHHIDKDKSMTFCTLFEREGGEYCPLLDINVCSLCRRVQKHHSIHGVIDERFRASTGLRLGLLCEGGAFGNAFKICPVVPVEAGRRHRRPDRSKVFQLVLIRPDFHFGDPTLKIGNHATRRAACRRNKTYLLAVPGVSRNARGTRVAQIGSTIAVTGKDVRDRLCRRNFSRHVCGSGGCGIRMSLSLRTSCPEMSP